MFRSLYMDLLFSCCVRAQAFKSVNVLLSNWGCECYPCIFSPLFPNLPLGLGTHPVPSFFYHQVTKSTFEADIPFPSLVHPICSWQSLFIKWSIMVKEDREINTVRLCFDGCICLTLACPFEWKVRWEHPLSPWVPVPFT